MNLAKFLDLLETQELHFARLSVMSDKYEGALSGKTYQEIQRFIHQNFPNGGADAQVWAEEAYAVNQHTVFVNCWYLAEYESAAMWQYYGDDGIAIRTTYGDLIRAVESEPKQVNIGTVRYGNYRNVLMNYGNTLAPVFYKRSSFDFERELRAAVTSVPKHEGSTMKDLVAALPSQPGFLRVKADISSLIKKVYVSPGKPQWYRTLIESVVRRYGLELEVETSTIDKRPNYQ